MILEIGNHIEHNIFIGDGNLTNQPGKNVYYCNCKHIFIGDNAETVSTDKSLNSMPEFNSNASDEDMKGDLSELYKEIQLSTLDEVRCPNCERNFSSIKNKHQTVFHNEYFLSGFKLEDTETSLIFYCCKVAANIISTDHIDFTEKVRYLKLEKSTKKLFFKDYETDEIEFDLDTVIKTCDKFFTFDTVKVINLFDQHIFIDELASHVSDAQNIDVISELKAELSKNRNNTGADIIKKIISIFFGIIKYSNLSTIAMTKGSIFLYDLMKECNIPNAEQMIKSEATSPLKIFNFLIKNYIRKLNQSLSSEDKNQHAFVYKSKTMIALSDKDEKFIEIKEMDNEKQKELQISNFSNYKEGKVKKAADGTFQVMETIDDGTLSKFLFKHITKFSEYAQIVKFFKLVNKEQLIVLLNKYDIQFLVNIIDLLYFRAKVDFKELQRIIEIMFDFTTKESKKFIETIDGEFVFKLKPELAKTYDFQSYDHSLLMIASLEFDRKRDFDKIKTFEKLKEYHDYLIVLYASVTDEKKNGSILRFVEKFRFLENKEKCDHLLIDFVLLDTPGAIMRDGIDQKHSGFSYAPRVAQGGYLMGQLYDRTLEKEEGELERMTIGFNYSSREGLEFEEVAGFANQWPSDRQKKLVQEWLTIKDVSWRPVGSLRLTKETVEYKNFDEPEEK